MVEQCRPLSEWIGIFSPIFSDIATQKSMADRSERIEWQSKLIVSSGATHCVSVRRRVCEAHRRVPCLGVKWDKGRKRRRADEWKWKEGADEKLFGGPTPAPPVDTTFFSSIFPPINNIGWTDKEKIILTTQSLAIFLIGCRNFAEFSDWSLWKKTKKNSGKIWKNR